MAKLHRKRAHLARTNPEPSTEPGPIYHAREDPPPMQSPTSSQVTRDAEQRWRIDPSRLSITGDVLGRGAMGVVRLGYLDGKMPVAVKLLHAPSSVLTANVERELETLAHATVHCTHVCRLIGVCSITTNYSSFPEMGSAGDAIALVMKKYECTLTDLLQAEPERRFSPQMAMSVGAQLAKAIDELHELKILIRDLKPSNILFDKYGGLVISDFGISVQLDESITHMMPTSVQGTVAYMSPEALDPEMYGGVGMPSDIWALGCCVIEMLSGRQPFAGVPYHQIMRKVCDRREAPELPRGLLAPDMEQLLTRCVSHSPNARPRAAEAYRAFSEMVKGLGEQGMTHRLNAPAAGGDVTASATDAQRLTSAVGTTSRADEMAWVYDTPFAQVQQTPSDPTLELLTLRIARFATMRATDY